MEDLKPPVPESRYAPLTLEEFQALKNDLKGITHTLPTHLTGIFWDRCNKVRGERAQQPCTCQSAAKHWGACVETLQKFVKEKDEQNQ